MTTVRVDKSDLQVLFDLAVNSLDFGSGWWDDDETAAARRIAEAIGVDPKNATPRNFMHKYPHAYEGRRTTSGDSPCFQCSRPADWHHHTPKVTP